MKGGKRLEVSLCHWRGTPSASGLAQDRGDSEFEYSRIQAEEILENLTIHPRDVKEIGDRQRLEI